MTEWDWMVASAALAGAGVVKGLTGIGYATLALPMLVGIVGLHNAMALIIAPTLAANVGLALTGGHFRHTVRAFGPMYLAMLPGVVLGGIAATMIAPRDADMILGGCLMTYVAVAMTKPSRQLSPRMSRALSLPVGLLSGVLTGMTGSQVFPLVPYLMAAESEPARFVQATNLGVLILSSLLALSLAATQTIHSDTATMSAMAIVPALMGSGLGVVLRRALSTAILKPIVLVVVAISGLKLVVG
jgi:uncharacterized protein